MAPRVVFHHVAKCAGTTVLKFLEGTVPPERAAFLEALLGFPDPHGADRIAVLQRAAFLHDPFGVHDWKGLFGDVVDMIFLRDPVDRLWSEWRMITRWDDGLVASRGEPYRRLRDVARAGFGAFLGLPGIGAFANALACHLARGEPVLGEVRAATAAGGAPPPALVDLLDERLAAIDVVGFVDDFDTSLVRLVAAIGWPPPDELQLHNVHPAPLPLAPEERARAEACTALDRRLVDGARQRLRSAGPPDAVTSLERARWAARDRVLEPPASLLLEMGEALVGSGWHPCEVNGRRRARWTGPGPVATLELRVDRRRPLGIRFRVGNHLRAAQVDDLALAADGVSCDVDHWVLPPFDHFFEATIPAAPLDLPLLRLSIDCREAVRPPDPADTRLLGVEIEEIEILPADRRAPRSLAALGRVRDELAALASTPDGDRRMQHLLASALG